MDETKDIIDEEKNVEPSPETLIDEDFADAKANLPEEKKEEEKAPEPAPEPEPEPEPAPEPEPEGPIEYGDPRLEEIENARLAWNRSYRKTNSLKMTLTIIAIVLILAGYMIPYFAIQDEEAKKTWTLVVCGICAAIGLGGVAAYGFIARKKNREAISNYFNAYYSNINDFAFDGLPIENMRGDADSKIEKAEVDAACLYPNTQVGSRDNITFTYDGMDCALCEMAAQKDTGKALTTVFIGKYLRAHNNLPISSDGLVIYFKGNERALPPTVKLPIISETKKYVVYGDKKDERFLSQETWRLLKQIRTDRLLVDVAISIKPGRTYIALGYEDDLMILPNDKPFDPRYVKAYAEQIKLFLQIAKQLERPLETIGAKSVSIQAV